MKSTTARARPNSNSLRATIPVGVVEFLQLKLGDDLDWRMEIKNGERLVEVRKTPKTA
jgi:predicted metal-dependent peptidase